MMRWTTRSRGGAAVLFSVLTYCAAGCTGRAGTQSDAELPVAAPEVAARPPCPEGTRRRGERCVTEASAPETPDPAASPAAPEKPASAIDELARTQRDLRPKVMTRSHALLIVELQQLESLLGSTPKSAADRPRILMRTAADQSELAVACETQRPSGGETPRGLAETARKAHLAASQLLSQLADQYPLFCRRTVPGDPSQSQGCADESRYLAGYEAELAGDIEAARRSYLRVLKDAPTSLFTPYAYVAFGEAFLREADSDASHLKLAAECYERAKGFPDSKIRPLALLRAAETYERMEDKAHAIAAYQALLKAYPDSPEAALVPPEKRVQDL
jgi:TolA-binding protein